MLIVLNPGQELGDHQVKENAWVTVLEGVVRISAGGEAVEAGPGMLFRFDPDERHSLRSEEGARVLLLLAPWPGDGHYRGSSKSYRFLVSPALAIRRWCERQTTESMK